MKRSMQRQITMIVAWSILNGKSSSYITAASFRSGRMAASLLAFQTPSSFHKKKPNENQQRLFTFSTSRTFRSNTSPSILEEELEHIRRPAVQWYPGHIAKAERQLSETLKAVDVVVEVRDGRAAKATSHPRVGEWCAGRPRIVVLTHVDQIPKPAITSWKRAYDKFGAHGTDMEGFVNFAQVLNQAKQNKDQRGKFTTTSSNNSKKRSSDSNNKRNQNSNAVISPVEQVLFVDAKQGQGIHALHRAIFKAGAHVQERRDRRGLKERALRVGIIGYPNVGKSALINRILGRKRARTANTPGVTRSLQWIRVRTNDDISTSSTNSIGSTKSTKAKKKEFELLDSPGIIPAKMVDQSDAILLAACNCIGQAAYDNQGVAAYLCEWLKTVHLMGAGNLTAPQWRAKCQERYGFDPLEKVDVVTAPAFDDSVASPTTKRYRTGEDMLFQVADNTCQGDPEDASRKILQDFRAGRMGPVCLQVAPRTEEDDGQVHVPVGRMYGISQDDIDGITRQQEELIQQERIERAQRAVQVAKERGLELPPTVAGGNEEDIDDDYSESNKTDAQKDDDSIGKGLFDGW